MEIIGKVLSLTLLTIFGSAAAAVYLVDSDFFPSIYSKTPILYSSVSGSSDDNPSTGQTYNSNDVSIRKRRSKEYYEVSGAENRDTSAGTESIWGQNYAATQDSRAEYLASVNSMSTLRKEMKHWNAQYQNALDQGQKRIAKLAYSNYKDYKKAIEIKNSSDSQ